VKDSNHCRSCNAKVIWAKTVKGRAMPLDANPYDDGTLYLDEKLMKVYTDLEQVPANCEVQSGYKSHFATCPEAGKWRKR